jgi:hypothetical protein
MATLIAFAAIGLFTAGVGAGIIGVVSVAIRREERNFTLASEAPDNVTRAGRWLNGVGVRTPRRTAAADRPTARVYAASRPARGPAEPVHRAGLTGRASAQALVRLRGESLAALSDDAKGPVPRSRPSASMSAP